jgi:hypothetical protein
MWRSENSWPYRDANFDPSAVQPVVSRCTDWAIAAVIRGTWPYRRQTKNVLASKSQTSDIDEGAEPRGKHSITSFLLYAGVRRSAGRSLSDLLYQPLMTDNECRAVGGVRLGKGNLPQCHLANYKSHKTWPVLEPWPPRREARHSLYHSLTWIALLKPYFKIFPATGWQNLI